MTGYFEMRKKYFKSGDPNLLLQLLGNTVGNTNGSWLDTSTYATPATQPTITLQPILTADAFGSGNYGYIFDGINDAITIQDSDRFTFSDANGDLPFSVLFDIIIYQYKTNQSLLINKRAGDGGEWYIGYDNTAGIQSLYLGMWDNTLGGYIGAYTAINLGTNTIKKIKVTYSGAGKTGIKIYVNSILQTMAVYSGGNYVKMRNTTVPVKVNEFWQNSQACALTDLEIWKGVI